MDRAVLLCRCNLERRDENSDSDFRIQHTKLVDTKRYLFAMSQYTSLSDDELTKNTYYYGIIDCETLNCFGVCESLEEAIKAAEHCHKHHYQFSEDGYQINAFKKGDCRWGYLDVVYSTHPERGSMTGFRDRNVNRQDENNTASGGSTE